MAELTQRELDVRSLCGIKECAKKAQVLAAWPRRNPVPVCQEHWDIITFVVSSNKYTPEQWLKWITDNGKPHILPSHLTRTV